MTIARLLPVLARPIAIPDRNSMKTRGTGTSRAGRKCPSATRECTWHALTCRLERPTASASLKIGSVLMQFRPSDTIIR